MKNAKMMGEVLATELTDAQINMIAGGADSEPVCYWTYYFCIEVSGRVECYGEAECE